MPQQRRRGIWKHWPSSANAVASMTLVVVQVFPVRTPWRPPRRRWRVARCRVSAVAAVACAKRHNYYALDAPKTDPVIRTEKERIGVGETLRVNCTSGNSRPAPAVTWKLNGDSVSITLPQLARLIPYIGLRSRGATWPYWMIRVCTRKIRNSLRAYSILCFVLRSITSISFPTRSLPLTRRLLHLLNIVLRYPISRYECRRDLRERNRRSTLAMNL